jgi:predicted DNA-binding transcriptional regulator AlpA
MHDDELLDIDEVCTFLGGSRPINPSTVWRGIKAGRFSAPVYVTKQNPRWRRSDLERDLAALTADRDNNT